MDPVSNVLQSLDYITNFMEYSARRCRKAISSWRNAYRDMLDFQSLLFTMHHALDGLRRIIEQIYRLKLKMLQEKWPNELIRHITDSVMKTQPSIKETRSEIEHVAKTRKERVTLAEIIARTRWTLSTRKMVEIQIRWLRPVKEDINLFTGVLVLKQMLDEFEEHQRQCQCPSGNRNCLRPDLVEEIQRLTEKCHNLQKERDDAQRRCQDTLSIHNVRLTQRDIEVQEQYEQIRTQLNQVTAQTTELVRELVPEALDTKRPKRHRGSRGSRGSRGTGETSNSSGRRRRRRINSPSPSSDGPPPASDGPVETIFEVEGEVPGMEREISTSEQFIPHSALTLESFSERHRSASPASIEEPVSPNECEANAGPVILHSPDPAQEHEATPSETVSPTHRSVEMHEGRPQRLRPPRYGPVVYSSTTRTYSYFGLQRGRSGSSESVESAEGGGSNSGSGAAPIAAPADDDDD